MNLNEELKRYKEKKRVQPKQAHVASTIKAAKESFFAAEERNVLSYASFLYLQFRLTQKRWWLLQAVVLAALWRILPLQDPFVYGPRSMGVAGTLFVIFVIPELWKSRSSRSMEIEAAAYYSLRQIYAARMLLFGVVDMLLLTLFFGATSMFLGIAFTDLVAQFLFPMTVTACICFGVLCGKRCLNEAASVGLCLIWAALWWLVLLNESIYAAIMAPVWHLMLAMALLFLGFSVRRAIRLCDELWEENGYGIEHE